MPPNSEYTITAPLPEPDLRQLIHEVNTTFKFISIEIKCISLSLYKNNN